LGGVPSHFTVDFDLVSPVELTGIPTSYTFDIHSLPKIQIGMDPITVNPLTVNPLDVSVRLKEVPSVRGHIPANFTVGMSVLGLQLFTIRLCGEAQVITEPYVPNPCEVCGTTVDVPTPPPVNNKPGIAGAAKPAARVRRKG